MMETCWKSKEKISLVCKLWSIPVSARSNALICSRSLVRIAGSNSTGSRDVRLLCNMLCYQVELSATG